MANQPPSPKPNIWRELRSLLRPWRALIGVIAVCVLLAEGFAVVPPTLMQRIIDDYLSAGVQQGVLAQALLYLGATTAALGTDFCVTYLTALVAQGALRDLRVRLFAHLQHLPLSYYDRTPLGDVISRCTADVETVNTLFVSGVSRLITRLVQLATALAAMLLLSPRLSLVALALIPPLVLVTRFFQVHIRDAERERRRAIGTLNVQLQETLGGVEIVRAFGREGTFVAHFRLALRQTLTAYARTLSFNVFYTPLLTVLVAASVGFLLWLGSGGAGTRLGFPHGSPSIGTLAAFILLFQRFFEPIRNLGEDWQTVQSALSGLERIVQVLRTPAEEHPRPSESANDRDAATEPSRAATEPSRAATEPSRAATEPSRAAIELRDIVFGYLPQHPVLRGVTLIVQPGEHVALVGRTGAGKSSLVSLLGGLYAPWSGRVRVAGRDPHTLDDEKRRHVVGVVPQTVQLFSGTVVENLTLGDSAVPQAAIERAARIAVIDRFISALPQGYHTPLSGIGRGKGVQFSQGQQQLLSLARALVWDPAILLLDEATAAVDNASEAEFRSALKAAQQTDEGRQRAVVTVAHRLSTAREADRVVVIEEGRIVEQGPPEVLIQRGGKFAALVELERAGWDWQDSV